MIIKINKTDYIGKSSDVKPSSAVYGASFYELDTRREYYKNIDGTWEEPQGTGGPGGGSTTVNNTLVSSSTTQALSANQGRILKGLIDSLTTLLESDEANLDSLQEIVDFIELNRDSLDNLTINAIAGLQNALNAKASQASQDTQDAAIAANTAKNTYPVEDSNKVANLPADQSAVNQDLQTNKEPAKGADDNYVTNAEKVVIGNTLGVNTGNQTSANLPVAGNYDVLGNPENQEEYNVLNVAALLKARTSGVAYGIKMTKGSDNTSIDFTLGSAQSLDTSDQENLEYDSFDIAVQNIQVSNLATGARTFWYLDVNDGTIKQQSAVIPVPERPYKILLGRTFANGTQVTTVANDKDYTTQLSLIIRALADFIGVGRKSGLIYNALNTTQIQRSAGVFFAFGEGEQTDFGNIAFSASSPHSFLLYKRDGNVNGAGVQVTTYNVTQYDNNGVMTTMTNNNRWRVDQIWGFSSGNTAILIGQAEYTSLGAAQAARDTHIIPSVFADGGLMGYVYVLKNGLLTNTAQVKFVNSRNGGGGSNINTADGVISNVSIAGSIITFTGSGGGFNGTISLQDLIDSLNSDNKSTIAFAASRNVSAGDVGNVIQCTTDATLTITENFNSMNIGDVIDLEAHGTLLSVQSVVGVDLDDEDNNLIIVGNGSANVAAYIRKIGTNSYLLF